MLYVDLFDSKAIARFAYDPDAKRLLIDFKTGGVYAYQEVPRAVFAGFRAAQSKGQFFQTAIRDRFTGRRLAPAEVAALERREARGTDSALREMGRVDITTLGRPGKRAVFF
jgi:hypothetical protein